MAEKVFKSPYPTRIPTDYYKPVELVSNFPKTDIFKTGVNSLGTTTIIYTVPVGKVFVLEYFYLWYSQGSSDASRADQVLYAGSEKLFEISSPQVLHTEGANAGGMAIALPRGLRFPAGTIFKIDAGTSDIGLRAGVYGFETLPEYIVY